MNRLHKDRYLKYERKKWVSVKVDNTNQTCPKCGIKSDESVLPCDGDFWYCKNIDCLIINFSDVGYYVQDKNGDQEIGLHKKESYGELQDEDLISGITCRKCNQPISKKELNDGIKSMILTNILPEHDCPSILTKTKDKSHE